MIAALPMLPLALAGHLLVIPRYGARGATVVTLVVAAIGAGSRSLRRTARGACVRRAHRRASGGGDRADPVGRREVATTGARAIVELGVMSVVAILALIVLGERVAPGRELG